MRPSKPSTTPRMQRPVTLSHADKLEREMQMILFERFKKPVNDFGMEEALSQAIENALTKNRTVKVFLCFETLYHEAVLNYYLAHKTVPLCEGLKNQFINEALAEYLKNLMHDFGPENFTFAILFNRVEMFADNNSEQQQKDSLILSQFFKALFKTFSPPNNKPVSVSQHYLNNEQCYIITTQDPKKPKPNVETFYSPTFCFSGDSRDRINKINMTNDAKTKRTQSDALSSSMNTALSKPQLITYYIHQDITNKKHCFNLLFDDTLYPISNNDKNNLPAWIVEVGPKPKLELPASYMPKFGRLDGRFNERDRQTRRTNRMTSEGFLCQLPSQLVEEKQQKFLASKQAQGSNALLTYEKMLTHPAGFISSEGVLVKPGPSFLQRQSSTHHFLPDTLTQEPLNNLLSINEKSKDENGESIRSNKLLARANSLLKHVRDFENQSTLNASDNNLEKSATNLSSQTSINNVPTLTDFAKSPETKPKTLLPEPPKFTAPTIQRQACMRFFQSVRRTDNDTRDIGNRPKSATNTKNNNQQQYENTDLLLTSASKRRPTQPQLFERKIILERAKRAVSASKTRRISEFMPPNSMNF